MQGLATFGGVFAVLKINSLLKAYHKRLFDKKTRSLNTMEDNSSDDNDEDKKDNTGDN